MNEVLPLLNDSDRTAFLVGALFVWFIVLAFIAVGESEHDEEDE